MHHGEDNVLASWMTVISLTLIRQNTFSWLFRVYPNYTTNVKYQHACLCTYLCHLNMGITAALKETAFLHPVAWSAFVCMSTCKCIYSACYIGLQINTKKISMSKEYVPWVLKIKQYLPIHFLSDISTPRSSLRK